jgi:addiction module HigA family antidote
MLYDATDLTDRAGCLETGSRPCGETDEVRIPFGSTINSACVFAGELKDRKVSRSSTTTRARARLRPHPGEVLREACLVPLGMSARKLAEVLVVPHNRIPDTVRERRSVTADPALRLAKYFGTSAEFWLNRQSSHDLSKAAATTDYSRIQRRAV